MRCQPCSGAGRIAAAFRLLPAGRVSAPDDPCIGRFEKEVAWLRDCHGSGATLACTCTAAMMLAQTGLLDGMEATIHWNYAPSLAKHYPCLKVDPDKALVVTGEDNRIVMAGGGTSHLDLILYLIARLGFVTVETQNGQKLFTIPYMIQRCNDARGSKRTRPGGFGCVPRAGPTYHDGRCRTPRNCERVGIEILGGGDVRFMPAPRRQSVDTR